MKVKIRKLQFSRLLINPFLLSTVITLIVIGFMYKRFDRFIIETVNSADVNPLSHNYFHDLNQDEISEWIELGYNQNDLNFPYYIVYTQLGRNGRLIKGQYNLDKKWLGSSRAHFGDIDGDNMDEILFFTVSSDSLFLFCGDPYDHFTKRFEIFLDHVNFREDSPDFEANILNVYDFDNDGYKDVLLRINAGFSLDPREYFIYNLRRENVTRSRMGFAHLAGAVIYEAPGLGPVILPVRSYAPQNVKIPVMHTDSVSWLALFDRKLESVFPPIRNNGFKTNLQSRLKLENGELFIYSLFYDHDKTNNPPSLIKYDLAANKINEKTFRGEDYQVLNLVSLNPEGILYLRGPDLFTLTEIGPDLELGRKKTCYLSDSPFIADLNQDGQHEIISILPGNDYFLYICQENLKHETRINIGSSPEISIFSTLATDDEFANIAVQVDDQLHYLKFDRNPLYFWNYIIYTGIWAGLSLFFFLILQMQKSMLRRKYEQERKMTELELMTIKNQVDPHFMFNTMNAIGSYILKEDKKRAYDYLISFSQMIRNTLTHSREISINLQDELDFVEKYLELEQLRLSNAFEYRVILNPEIDPRIRVPKMIIQTFAENAVKHGLRHKRGPGKLEIEIKIEREHLEIRIEDNGIGREGSGKMKTHGTGYGENIVRQIVSLFNRLNDTEVSFGIVDLKDASGHPTGTRVLVRIPYKHG